MVINFNPLDILPKIQMVVFVVWEAPGIWLFITGENAVHLRLDSIGPLDQEYIELIFIHTKTLQYISRSRLEYVVERICIIDT